MCMRQADLRHKAQAAACAEVAEALCDLEGRLPPSGEACALMVQGLESSGF